MNFGLILQEVKSGAVSIVEQVPAMLAFVGELADPETLQECQAQAAAVLEYLSTRKLQSVGEYNAALKVRLRVEHRLGEILAETVSGGRPQKKCDAQSQIIPDGITRKESSLAQQLAAVPWESVESAIDTRTDTNQRASRAGVLRAVEQSTTEPNGSNRRCIVDDLHRLVREGKRYGTIYADPPWSYGNQATRASTDKHYVTMSVDEIVALPVRDLAADYCHLHLWTTNAFLFECPKLCEAWGFTYQGVFVWCKPQMGIGNCWRVSHEFLLLAIRGEPRTFRDRSLKSWGEFKRGRHSAKPEQVRLMIEKASPGPYLELFGRRTAPGWDVWGNEVERDLFSPAGNTTEDNVND